MKEVIREVHFLIDEVEWKQFNKFVDALNDLRDRLAPVIFKKSGVG